jgi:hypothetical protein
MPGLKSFPVLLSILFICSIPPLLPIAAEADGPSCATHEFHGTVSNAGKVVGAGYVVTAMVNGQEMASATTDTQGRWGNSQPFTVATNPGSLIEFYINGHLVGSAASCIATNELNLSAAGASPARGSTNQVATDTTAASSTSTATGASQPPLISTPSDAPSSQSTLTFLIGPQSSAARTSWTGVVIECSLLGQQDSLMVSNAVLTAPKELDGPGGSIEMDFVAGTAMSLLATQHLTAETAPSAPAPSAGSALVSAYSLEPDSCTLVPPVTLRLKYDRGQLPTQIRENGLYIAQLTQAGQWIALPSSIDKDSQKVSAQISHFSTYGLIGALTPESEVVTPQTPDPRTTASPINHATADSVPQDKEGRQPPAVGGMPTQISGMEILVFGILIAGSIAIVILFLAILRKRQRY